ncbi:hypothetical protein Tco_0268798 [Tanacetum coccineum]
MDKAVLTIGVRGVFVVEVADTEKSEMKKINIVWQVYGFWFDMLGQVLRSPEVCNRVLSKELCQKQLPTILAQSQRNFRKSEEARKAVESLGKRKGQMKMPRGEKSNEKIKEVAEEQERGKERLYKI